METPLIFLIIAYVIIQAAAMGFLYLTLCEVLRRLQRIDVQPDARLQPERKDVEAIRLVYDLLATAGFRIVRRGVSDADR